jgi:hypothetical protein
MYMQKYIQRAFEALKKFNRDYNHHGLALALGPEKAIIEVTFDVTEHIANNGSEPRPEIRKLFREYGNTPVLFNNDVYKVFKLMSSGKSHVDSLLSIDQKGYIIKIDGFLVSPAEFYSQIKDYDPDWGTRHWSCAAASCLDGVTTMALSEGRKTITTFHDGRVIDELCYHPHKKKD